jgi:hypothetical protein
MGEMINGSTALQQGLSRVGLSGSRNHKHLQRNLLRLQLGKSIV